MYNISEHFPCLNGHLEGWYEGIVFGQELVQIFAEDYVFDGEGKEPNQSIDCVALPLQPVDLAVWHTGKKLIPLLLLIYIFGEEATYQ